MSRQHRDMGTVESPTPDGIQEFRPQTRVGIRDINKYKMFRLHGVGANGRTGNLRIRLTLSDGSRPVVAIPIGKPFDLLNRCEGNREHAKLVYGRLLELSRQQYKMEPVKDERGAIIKDTLPNGQVKPRMKIAHYPNFDKNGNPHPEAGKPIRLAIPTYYLEPYDEAVENPEFELCLD